MAKKKKVIADPVTGNIIFKNWEYQAVDIIPVRPMQYRMHNDHWVILEPENISLKQIIEKYFKIFKKFQNFPLTFIV